MSAPGAPGRGTDPRALSAFEPDAQGGVGLFETLRVYAGRPFLWERHLARLVRSAAELGLGVPPASTSLRRGLDDLLAAEGLTDAVIRITVTGGPVHRQEHAQVGIEAEPVAARLWNGTLRGDARAIVSKTPFEPGLLGRHKTTQRAVYDLAREEARAAGADEALLVSPAGRMLEGAVSNVFALVGGVLCTPPLSEGILPGVTRGFVLEACRAEGIAAREIPLRPADLEAADEVFLTNSVQELVPLVRVDDHPVPSRALGQRLLAAYHLACGSRM